jgi:hypothetical protein
MKTISVNNIYKLKNFKPMAEIHVEPKKHQSTPAWVWILITLVILGLVAYFLTRNNTTASDNNTGNKSNTTSYVQPNAVEAGSAYYINAAA